MSNRVAVAVETAKSLQLEVAKPSGEERRADLRTVVPDSIPVEAKAAKSLQLKVAKPSGEEGQVDLRPPWRDIIFESDPESPSSDRVRSRRETAAANGRRRKIGRPRASKLWDSFLPVNPRAWRNRLHPGSAIGEVTTVCVVQSKADAEGDTSQSAVKASASPQISPPPGSSPETLFTPKRTAVVASKKAETSGDFEQTKSWWRQKVQNGDGEMSKSSCSIGVPNPVGTSLDSWHAYTAAKSGDYAIDGNGSWLGCECSSCGGRHREEDCETDPKTLRCMFCAGPHWGMECEHKHTICDLCYGEHLTSICHNAP